MSDKTAMLLELLDKATETERGKERALYCLLKAFEADLPEPEYYFHASFRQTDVISAGKGGFVYMAIWNLLQDAPLFWECFEAVQEKQNDN